MTQAAGMPRAISPARLGPERTAMVAPGRFSASNSLMSNPRSLSIPFVQETRMLSLPIPTEAISPAIAARYFEGTAKKITEAPAHSVREFVGQIVAGRTIPGRYFSLRRSRCIAATWATSCPQSEILNTDSLTFLAIRSARAVPHPPAPITLTVALLMMSSPFFKLWFGSCTQSGDIGTMSPNSEQTHQDRHQQGEPV